MGANKPRRNHYIAETLQNHFCDDDGRLWVGDKCGRKPFHTSPGKVFVERNLYTTNDYVQSVGSYENEAALQRIEDGAAPVIAAIIEQARSGSPPQPSPEDRDRFKRFIIAQARRTPESQERIGLTADVDDVFLAAATEVLKRGGYAVPDEHWFEQGPILAFKQTYKSNLVGNFAAGTHHLLEEETERFCRETGLLVAVIDIPNRGFVIGSHGLTVVKENGQPGSWLPIAHDVAVKVTPHPDGGYFLRLDRDKDPIIRAINQSTVTGSRFIAGQSKALIEALMRGYWKRNPMPTLKSH